MATDVAGIQDTLEAVCDELKRLADQNEERLRLEQERHKVWLAKMNSQPLPNLYYR